MRLKDNESGQVLVITAVCMVGFMGFLALAVDVGILFHTKRQLQIAADAAATAAAIEYLHNGYSQANAITAGTNAATANNVSDGNTMTPTVTVNANAKSPASHKGCSGTTCFFEAVVSKPNPTIFYKTFFSLWKGSTGSAFTVAARAVAGTPGNATGCAYLTASTGSPLTVQGNWTINASSCGMYINSNSSSVEADTGKAKNSGVEAVSVSVVGSLPNDVTIAPGSNAVVTQVLPQTIPFTNLTPPAPTGCNTAPGGTLTAATGPGCYSGKVSIGGGVTLQAGTYIFNNGNVTITGSVTAHNVAFDIVTGSLTVNPGNAALDFTAPTTGVFNGVSLYMPFSNKNPINLQAGHATGSFNGFIVAPGSQLTMQDHGGSMTIGGLVVDSINNGPAVLNISGYSPSTSPLKYVTLVE